MLKPKENGNDIEVARTRWLSARECASKLADKLFQPGSGYGDPNARATDEHLLQSARYDAESLFQEYQILEKREIERKVLELQHSQRLATWASFAVAVVVGAATIIELFQ